jgi:hypothetical protein
LKRILFKLAAAFMVAVMLLLMIPPGIAAAATQDFSTYTEVDPNSHLSVSAYQVTFSHINRDEFAGVYKDFGEDYFSGDFQVDFTVKSTDFADYTGTGYIAVWAMTDNLTDLRTIQNNNDCASFLWLKRALGSTKYPSFSLSSYSPAGDAISGTYKGVINTDYYITIVRSEAVGFGTLTAYIYSDSARENLLQTLDLEYTSKDDYRYNWATLTVDTDESVLWCDGYVKDMSLTSTSGAPEMVVTTGGASDEAGTSATIAGNIQSLGSFGNATDIAIRWGTVADYDSLTENVTANGSYGTGAFSLSCGPFVNGTTYYYQAIAFDGDGWHYGTMRSFLFDPPGPSVVLSSATKIDDTSFETLSIVTALGAGSDNYTIRGVQIGTATGVYTDNFTENGSWAGVGLYGNYETTVTDLTPGVTYYYRAMVYDGYWGYSAEETYINTADPVITVTTGGTSSAVVGGVTAYTFGGTASANFTFSTRGFQIGYADGVWENTLKLSELAVGSSDDGYWSNSQTGETTPWTDNSTSGSYAITSAVLSANTTYYYRAFAGVMLGGDWWYFYGTSQTLTTAGGAAVGYPVVTTDGAYCGIDYVLTMSGTIVSSPAAVVARGFEYSLNADMSAAGSITKLSNAFPFGYYMESFSSPGVYTAPGETVYIRAFATNSAGNTGYGSIISYTIPQWATGPDGLNIINGEVSILGNSATLRASIINPGAVAITRYGFEWGLTSGCDDGAWNTLAPAGITAISHVVTNLSPSYTYFYRAGVLLSSGNWYWSTPTTFTTREEIPDITGAAPVVETLAASGIGGNYFTANGALMTKGSTVGSVVSVRGFCYSLENSGQLSDWSAYVENGDFDVEGFSRQVTLTQSNVRVYYAALATNQYGTSYGQVWYVNLTSGTSGGTPGGGSGGSTPGAVDGFTGTLTDWMASMGMDTSTGHWGFMFIVMMVVAAAFVTGIIAAHERILKTALIVVFVLAEVAVVGAFMFSGLLGIWPVIILIFAVVGLVIVFGGRLLSHGRA